MSTDFTVAGRALAIPQQPIDSHCPVGASRVFSLLKSTAADGVVLFSLDIARFADAHDITARGCILIGERNVYGGCIYQKKSGMRSYREQLQLL